MAIERIYSPERLIGCGPIDVVQMIFQGQPNIENGYLYPYRYVPGTPTGRRDYPVFFSHPFNRKELLFLRAKVDFLLQPGFDVGIASAVEVVHQGFRSSDRNVLRHDIPFIDFECPVTPENQTKVKSRLARLSIGGQKVTWVILDSGNSYQAYCIDYTLSSYGNRETILGFGESCRTILDFDSDRRPDPIASPWYFVHSQEQGCMVLRLTRNRPDLKKQIPVVIDWVTSEGEDKVYYPELDHRYFQ